MDSVKLGLMFIFLTVICAFLSKISIVFVGLMFVFLGLAILIFILGGLAASKTWAWLFSMYFILFGLGLVVTGYLVENNGLSDVYYAFEIALGVGVIVLSVFVFNISKFLFCSHKIKAEYLGHNVNMSRNIVQYSPRFRVDFEGKTFENSTGEVFGRRKIKKYVVGELYEININPKNPYIMRLRKRIGFMDILLLIMGSSLIYFAFYILA